MKETMIPISKREEIISEINNLLSGEYCGDLDSISLYNIAKLLKEKKEEENNTKNNYRKILKKKINTEFSNADIIIYDFDFENKEIRMGFKYIIDDYKLICFKKNEGDLYISQSNEHLHDVDIINTLGLELSAFYDDMMSFYDFHKDVKNYIKSDNSKFLVNISGFGVDILIKNPKDIFNPYFKLSSYSYTDEYKTECNSVELIEAVRGKGEEIFKNIYLCIYKCPKWSQDYLFDIRQCKLSEDQTSEAEEEEPKLKRKWFNFSKKHK